MTIEVDIAILGGGPAGYTAAIRAAQLGKRVVVVEMGRLGGTCLHQGCIPSKSLLRSAEVYQTVRQAERYGIHVSADRIELDYTRVSARKQETVDQLHRGLQSLMRKHEIPIIQGKGRVIGPSIFSPRSGSLAVELEDGEMETVVSKHLILATGSKPRRLKGLEPDGHKVMSSDDAIVMKELPRSLLIIGGGVIGVEWASMMSDFGVDVTLIEAASRLLPGEDAEVSAEADKLLQRRGVRVLTGITIDLSTFKTTEEQVSIQVDTEAGRVQLEAERVLVSVGRDARVQGIGLENTDVRTEGGVIPVNSMMQTSEPHIYAVGDVNGGLQLAHAAAHEAIIAVEHICGLAPQPLEAHRVPRAIYSRPEIASIGYTEYEVAKRGYEIKTGKIPFAAIGKAWVRGETEGFVKVIADRATGDILGVHIIGPGATDMISEAALAQLLNATPWEASQAIRPHPSLSEALGEAMLAVDGHALAY
ncbi:dihydrolipoyl dehydrogenase [Paenibacillus daejeonensis]|uniref:dihydrolipoyl dehydrogenase n=1 Tax=Paenibacillus daejeonensis TaxID=135193 RepID=UPI000377E092|nr:dihydrolipoyl dehydrogenase [Paenibacillus daejeonensis]